jgi:hypothetical protein
MEKVFINPVAKEILIKGNAKEGPVDLFSYDGDTRGSANSRALGNLYVIGNIQQGAEDASDDIDVGYVLNLVASLAKREYYANQDLSPKDAFSGALKKINGVVEEFFKKKDTKINIGIFAIAGDQIHISKLGKFKILLARDDKNIDILNNIQLFDKESTQEKEFSNIISGKITEGDRLLAYYPSRSTTAREKFLKDHLLNASQDEFVTHVASVKEAKPEFACTAFHIDLQKCTEAATAPRIQPKELREIEEEVIEDEAPVAAPALLAKKDEEEQAMSEKQAPVAHVISQLPAEPAIPKIIPSEFARGKRELALSKHVRRLKNMNVTPRGKMFAMGGIAVVALLGIFSLKSFVFVDASTKQINTAVSEAQANLKLAQAKVDQNDFIGARTLLMGSLSALVQSESANGSSKKAADTKDQISKALDNLDQATDAKLNVVADIPADSGSAKLITSSKAGAFYAYLDQNGSGSLVKITDGSLGTATAIKDLAPNAIFSSDASIVLVDSNASKLTSLSTAKSSLSSKTFTTDPLVNFEVYQDNLYGLTGSSIIKITDAGLGHNTVQTWLASGTSLVSDSSLLAVDGNLYVLSKNGTLTTYYKGKKTNETTTAVSPETGSMLLTNTDSANLYLINTSTGRIYVLSKTTGAVSKTLKVNASKGITSAALGSDDTVYVLSDNKIWSVK